MSVARYSELVGKCVEARYRAGDVHLSAIATLVLDSGNHISLEEHFSQGGKEKTIRIEIPYECVLRIAEARAEPAEVTGSHLRSPKKS
jgi:hypothetical protein